MKDYNRIKPFKIFKEPMGIKVPSISWASPPMEVSRENILGEGSLILNL